MPSAAALGVLFVRLPLSIISLFFVQQRSSLCSLVIAARQRDSCPRARSFGVETHFIQRAGEINVHMPSYVVSKVQLPFVFVSHNHELISQQVTLALNDRCKAVNGARILIVGIAYKVGLTHSHNASTYEHTTHIHTFFHRQIWPTAARRPPSTFGLCWSKWERTSATTTLWLQRYT